MSAPTIGHTGEGLDWRRSGRCVGDGRDLWSVHRGSGAANQQAVTLCGVCPVRRRCRDDMLDFPDATDVVAGGWVWHGNRPVPYDSDEDRGIYQAWLAAKLDPRPGPTRRHDGRDVERIRRAFRVARRYVAGDLSRPAALRRVRRDDLDFATVILRFAPEVEERVYRGELTFYGATVVARRRKAGAA